MDLNDYLLEKLNEVEQNHSYEVATETVRCWIIDFIFYTNAEDAKNK